MSTQTATYVVDGMTCQHCVASVTEEVGEVAGVTGVEVDLATGRLTVHGDVAAEAVADAVTTAGFHVRQP
jgi:copper chaperone CopZ